MQELIQELWNRCIMKSLWSHHETTFISLDVFIKLKHIKKTTVQTCTINNNMCFITLWQHTPKSVHWQNDLKYSVNQKINWQLSIIHVWLVNISHTKKWEAKTVGNCLVAKSFSFNVFCQQLKFCKWYLMSGWISVERNARTVYLREHLCMMYWEKFFIYKIL